MKKIAVHLSISPKESRLVGDLAETGRRIYFEYDPAFLNDPLWLSPFKLPPEPGLHEHRDLSFGPLFGLFDDSLPDGWGLLLMDHYFGKQGIPPETVSPLDRLAHLGTRTMGALTYHPPTRTDEESDTALDLHHLAKEAYQVLEGTAADILPQLMRAGGSPGGARPKVTIGLKDDRIISGADQLPSGYTGWIVKFPSKQDAVDDGRVEFAYSNMARAAGLETPATRLFITAEGDAFFGVERFDRKADRRIHVHTFGNLIHSNFRIPGCDYEQLLKTTRILTRNQMDAAAALRLMVFNIFAHNRDDHVKNFAFLLNDHNEWRLAPAYDLTFAFGPAGEHTMTVAGEGRSPDRSHILQVAQRAGISKNQANEIIEEVAAAVSAWPRFAPEAGLPERAAAKITAFQALSV